MIGIGLDGYICRTRSLHSYPLIPGIITSISTRSGSSAQFARYFSAAAPSIAATTV